MWKLLPAILAKKIQTVLAHNGMLLPEQKVCIVNMRRTKECLRLNTRITEDAKQKNKKVEMMWLDYQKA